MRVKEVVYSRLFNIGDYSNERIGFKVEVEEGESPEEVVTKLAEKVINFSRGGGYGGFRLERGEGFI